LPQTQLVPQTLADLQAEIAALYDGSADVLTTADDDYNIRTILINKWIRMWGSIKEVVWAELWTTWAPGATYNASTLTYSLPADFRKPGGFVKLSLSGSYTYVPVGKPEKAQEYLLNGKPYGYITGPTGSKVLNIINGSASLTGATMTFDYYKSPLKLASASDATEMSDTTYVISGVCSDLAAVDENTNVYTIRFAEAKEALAGMIIDNEHMGSYQDSTVPDADYSPGFGE
jgi:hypothetical protein